MKDLNTLFSALNKALEHKIAEIEKEEVNSLHATLWQGNST